MNSEGKKLKLALFVSFIIGNSFRNFLLEYFVLIFFTTNFKKDMYISWLQDTVFVSCFCILEDRRKSCEIRLWQISVSISWLPGGFFWFVLSQDLLSVECHHGKAEKKAVSIELCFLVFLDRVRTVKFLAVLCVCVCIDLV